jgi:hypothetical protein
MATITLTASTFTEDFWGTFGHLNSFEDASRYDFVTTDQYLSQTFYVKGDGSKPHLRLVARTLRRNL